MSGGSSEPASSSASASASCSAAAGSGSSCDRRPPCRGPAGRRARPRRRRRPGACRRLPLLVVLGAGRRPLDVRHRGPVDRPSRRRRGPGLPLRGERGLRGREPAARHGGLRHDLRGDAREAGYEAGGPRPRLRHVRGRAVRRGPPAGRTACARVSPDATTAEALAATAKPLRYDTNALLCAIAGYPRKGCGEQVSADGSAKQEKKASDGGPSLGLPIGVGVVAILAGAAVWQARRRRNA
ncbi:GPS-CTERM domain-containing protein [Streptomyces diastatochromogenes]|nr:GPS-CTERM domain-containing protein [Streptomyces diastatochromogenes]